ncbi:ABC transporter permease [Chryseosolibacter histidini]|nr:ABC transporter permease [Chryseosolibacter histidini]
MAHLNAEHIDYIIKDLTYRGIVLEGLSDEMTDHVCSAVEAEMDQGKRFIDAYHTVLRSFGSTSGLRNIQHHTLRSENQKTNIMLRNYLTIAWRNLRKHSFYSFINIAGLAIGVAACLIIVLFIKDELRYDHYNVKADRIYRVHTAVRFGGNHFNMNYRSAPEAQTLMQEYPEIESAVRFRSLGSYLVKPEGGTTNVKEKNVVWADSTFFKIFSVPVLEGDPATALKEPASIAISKKMADKYFPGTSALGQSMILDNKYHAKVTAVYENIPVASHFHFDILISMVGNWPVAREAQSTSFLMENFSTYLLLKEGASASDLEQKLPTFLEKHMGPEFAQAMGGDFTMEKFKAAGNQYELSLMPLKDIHLYSDVRGEFEPNGSITYVYLFGAVATLILIIACINFMNLSTARSANRAKEVGMRKVMGSLRSHLVRQFLTESILVTLFSFVLALGLAGLFLPLFNNLSLRQLQLPFNDPLFYLVLLAASVIIGLMAGVYPSFFLSAFKPVNVLKGAAASGMKSGFIRSALVVFQFVISVFLIIATIAVNRQLNYIQHKKLGFEKDQVITIHDGYALRPNNVEAFKNEVLKISAVESGTISGFVPVESDWSWRSTSTFWRTGAQPGAENMVSFQRWQVDHDYVKTFRLNITMGRDFSAVSRADSNAVILNKTAVTMLELGDDPIGKQISEFTGNGQPLDRDHLLTWTVVGVVDDFHFSSMKNSITALGLFLQKSDGSLSFRFKPESTNEVVQSIEKIWKHLAPGQPFQYSFLDEDFESMYRAEQRLAQTFALFAVLAIIIACLGLFALTAFTAQQRTKEIGIRKVLGASVGSIVLLLSKDFGKLIVIAFALAAPLAWYAVDWWLQSYTYKTEIGVFVYLLAGALALIIALFTMSYQSMRAASADPVRSLRSE